MNDKQIRHQFHHKRLRKQHNDFDTIVVDELGIKHGQCRADIAVINGHLVGYEIKSDNDSLRRLPTQIDAYSAVFDRAFVIVGERHVRAVETLIPEWWGLILATATSNDRLSFKVERKARLNQTVDPFSVAQLLWRDEAVALLEMLGAGKKILRAPRKVIYQSLSRELDLAELRKQVCTRLKARTSWRHHEPPSPCVGLFQPCAK